MQRACLARLGNIDDEFYRSARETVSRQARNELETNRAQHLTIANNGVRSMLAEKFILMIEALIRAQSHADGSPRVVSTSPHVPVTLQAMKASK